MRFIILVLAIPLFLISCGKTEEGEQNRYERNLERLDRLAIDYPAFKPIFELQEAEAQSMMANAHTLQDEEERIDAMANANRKLIPSFVNDLEGFERQIQELRELSREAIRNADERVEEMLADVAVKEADRVIASTEDRLRHPPVADMADAVRRVKLTKKELDDAANTLKKVISETSVREVDTTG